MLKRTMPGLASLGLAVALLVGFPHPASADGYRHYHHWCRDRDHDCEHGDWDRYYHHDDDDDWYRYHHRYYDRCEYYDPYYDQYYYGYC